MSSKNKSEAALVVHENKLNEVTEGIVYLWHPAKGKRPFSKEHAKNLLKLEESCPSGWVKWTNQKVEVTQK